MAARSFGFRLPKPSMSEDDVPGNVVVFGGCPPEWLRNTPLAIRSVDEELAPHHTDAGTRAVVLLARDAEVAGRRADAVRCWAHESLLPLIALVPTRSDAQQPSLWTRTLTCAQLGDESHIGRLVLELDRDREGLPTCDDAEQTWQLRYQLRYGAPSRLGVGLDAFVVDQRAFIGGLLHPNVPQEAVQGALTLPPHLQVNTDALRSAAPLH